MSVIKEFCILMNKKVPLEQLNSDIRHLKFDIPMFRELSFDEESQELYGQELYMGYISIMLGEYPIGFTIYCLDSEKTYLVFGLTTQTNSDKVNDDLDYFISIFKTLPNLDVICFITDSHELSGVFDYDIIKKFRHDKEYLHWIEWF